MTLTSHYPYMPLLQLKLLIDSGGYAQELGPDSAPRPAGSGPASTTARASAPSIDVRMWELWGPVGVASQPRP